MRRHLMRNFQIAQTEWGYYHRLAREQFKGATVDEMLERLSPDELLRWMAWDEMNDKAREKRERDAEARYHRR